MYKCNDCGAVFREQGSRQKSIGIFDGVEQLQSFDCCPECNCDNFEEAKKCDLCDEHFPYGDMVETFCKDCFLTLVSMYGTQFYSVFGYNCEENEDLFIAFAIIKFEQGIYGDFKKLLNLQGEYCG